MKNLKRILAVTGVSLAIIFNIDIICEMIISVFWFLALVIVGLCITVVILKKLDLLRKIIK